MGSKIRAKGDCSHEIKRCLPLGRSLTNTDTTFKNRDIALSKKVHLVKTMTFPVVMYGCESWTIKKAEHQRLVAFELLEKTLESPLDCKEIITSQSFFFLSFFILLYFTLKKSVLNIHWKD